MITTDAPPRSQPPPSGRGLPGHSWGWAVQGGLLLAGFLYLYAGVFPALLADWLDDANYSHGFFVPALSAYFVWERRRTLAALRLQPQWGGLGLLGLGFGMLFLGHLGAEGFLMRLSMVVVITGLVWFLLGRHYVRALAFPLALLFFMIPLPSLLLNRLTMPLQTLATGLSTWALQLVHLPVYREGHVIFLPHATLEVVEACSGIRSLISLLTLGAVFAYLTQRQPGCRWLLTLSAIPIALVANALRIWGTGVLAHWYGAKVADGFYHTFAGWMVFVVALGLLLAVGGLLSLLRRAVEKYQERRP